MSAGFSLISLSFALFAQVMSERVPEVGLAIDACVQVPEEEVLRRTSLELDARVVPERLAQPNSTHVEVSCTGSHLRLRVSDPITGKHLERTLALTTRDVDIAGRTVALAVSELVLTSWMELTMKAPPPAATGFAPASAETRRAAQQRAEQQSADTEAVRLDEVAALAAVIGPFSRVGWGLGAGLRSDFRFNPDWFGAELELLATRGRTQNALGHISIATWSAALRARARLHVRDFWLDCGPGARFGFARLTGTPFDSSAIAGATFAGSWAGPLVYAGTGVKFGHAVLSLGAEGGYVLRSVAGTVSGARPVAIDGFWFMGSAALGWSP